eukprot:15436698-Alexandrium_andersonii.AAC.1
MRACACGRGHVCYCGLPRSTVMEARRRHIGALALVVRGQPPGHVGLDSRFPELEQRTPTATRVLPFQIP